MAEDKGRAADLSYAGKAVPTLADRQAGLVDDVGENTSFPVGGRDILDVQRWYEVSRRDVTFGPAMIEIKVHSSREWNFSAADRAMCGGEVYGR